MKKRIFIVHGWGAVSNEGWFSWLKRELEFRGFLVFSLQMPNTNQPRIKPWVNAIASAVGKVDSETFFVGHSLGCQAIARYLNTPSKEDISGGAVFVAGFFKRLTNMPNDDLSQEIIKEWLNTPLDFVQVKNHLLKSVAVFSDDDKYVPSDNIEDFKSILNSKIIIEQSQGHFSSSSGLPKYQVILEAILNISAA